MDEIESEVVDSPNNETEEVAAEVEVKADKPERTPEEELKYFEGRAERIRTKLGLKSDKSEVTAKPSTGELDETQLDYLDLKGISEQEDIDVIGKVMKQTGQSLRDVLKDDYVSQKLKANQDRRIVANATPTGTKRSGANPGMALDSAIAKYEQTNELPDDFELRSKVIEARMDRDNPSLPPWRRK